MAGQEKISLTAEELRGAIYRKWACFARYGGIGCGLKCSRPTHLLCRKVTLFLRGGK